MNPFPGLRPFDFEESALFFGRDGQSEEMIRKLGRTRFLAVVGASGSGKSSLVRAGLLPALLGGFMTRAGSNWRFAILRPGHDPLGNLARALNQPGVLGSESEESPAVQAALTEATLRRGGLGLVQAVRQAGLAANERVLILVDQFEEIFRFARVAGDRDYQNEAAAFVKLILEATRSCQDPIYVVLTMRSDFLGECSRFWDLPEAVNDSQYLIPRLTRDQLREAIAGPVAVGGAEITPRLLNRLLNDVGDDQDQLPILQHALMRTWDERVREGSDGEPLDLGHYEAIGGMAEALSLHADEAFHELPDDRSRQVAENVFKRLTEKGPDNREIRRPATLREICASADATLAEAITVIETFRQAGRSFLMPPEGTSLDAESLIDISHESLIRGWHRLRTWVEEEAESARIYRRLAETAILHQEGKAALWGDPDLQVALDWREKNRPNLAWARRYAPHFETAMAFLEASAQRRADDLAERERRQTEEIERAHRELEQAQALAEVQRQRVEEQRQRLAEQTRAASRLRRLTAASLLLASLALAAAVFALVAYRRADAERRNADLQSQIATSGQLAVQSDQLRSGPPRLFMQSLLLAIEAHRRYPGRESDAALRASLALAPLPGPRLKHQGAVEAVAFSADGRYVFTASRDKTLGVFDRASGRELARLTHRWGVNALAVSPDGSLVACGAGDAPQEVANGGLSPESAGEARVWDWRGGKEFARLQFAKPVRLVRFVGGGNLVAAADSGSLKIATFDRKGAFDAREIATTPGNSGWIASFSDDGALAAVRRPDEAEIVNVVTGSVAGRVKIVSSEDTIVFSPDNTRLAVTGAYGGTRVLDWAGGKLIAERKHPGATRTAFSPNGQLLAQIDGDGIARVWRIDNGDDVGVMKRGEMLSGAITDLAAFLPDSKALATTLDDDAVRVWRPYKKVNGDAATFLSSSARPRTTRSPPSRSVPTRDSLRQARSRAPASGNSTADAK